MPKIFLKINLEVSAIVIFFFLSISVGCLFFVKNAALSLAIFGGAVLGLLLLALLFTQIFLRQRGLHERTMNLALSISDYYAVIYSLSRGMLDIKANENTGEEIVDGLGKLTNALIERLNLLTQIDKAIAAGDYDVVVPLFSEKDVLGATFHNMLKELQKRMNEIYMSNMNLAINLTKHFDIINKLAQGNFTVTAVEEEDDELFQRLGKCTNEMVKSVNKLIQHIKDYSATLARTSKMLADVANQSTQSSSQLSGTISNISSASSHIAESIRLAKQSTSAASSLTKEGKYTVEMMFAKIHSIQNSIDQSVKSMEELAHYNSKISEIANIITKIAAQTNLLSLNASIEAVHAGELGKGFGVVADEIKKLAESSEMQAQKISKLINEVVTKTQITVDLVKQNGVEFQEEAQIVDKTHTVFGDITQSINAITLQIEGISMAVTEAAASAEEATASSEVQSASIEELSIAIAELAEIAQSSQEVVEKFKV